ncbi:MAG: permease-like cell division protein FtsX [Gammaproteobacteria bacterium]
MSREPKTADAGRAGVRDAASAPRRGLGSRLAVYGLRHLQVFFYTLGQLWRTPFATLMTAAVIGIALALPAGLQVLLNNAQRLSQGWDGATQISLFLKNGVSEERARDTAGRLRARSDIASVEFISKEEALEEFRRLSGFGDALKALDANPLPSVIVVHPALGTTAGVDATRALLKRLRALPEVDIAQLDMQWVKRLYAIMDIVRRGVNVLGLLLGLAVILVVGNTIRLAIQNRRDEIVIIKLIGGTDAFIRRPFLYTGFWYGLFGSLIAYFLVSGSLLVLSDPVRRLAGLYGSHFRLSSLDGDVTLALLGGGILLGLLGSWVAVGRHLRAIEPT